MRRSCWLSVVLVVAGGAVACGDGESGLLDEGSPRPVPVTSTADTTDAPGTPLDADGVLEAVDDDGVRYAVIVTSADPSPEGSAGGCVPAADPGRTNLRFMVQVGPSPTSSEDRPTMAVPTVAFRLNLRDDGRSVDPAATTFDAARFADVEARWDGHCEGMNSIGPGLPGLGVIETQYPLAFVVTAGPTDDPPPDGIVLYVRVVMAADGEHVDLAVPYDP